MSKRKMSLEEALSVFDDLALPYWRDWLDERDLSEAAAVVAEEIRALRSDVNELKQKLNQR